MADLQGAICGLGNPLLDISAHVDQAFLDKYQVPVSPASTIAASEPQTPLRRAIDEQMTVCADQAGDADSGGAAPPPHVRGGHLLKVFLVMLSHTITVSARHLPVMRHAGAAFVTCSNGTLFFQHRQHMHVSLVQDAVVFQKSMLAKPCRTVEVPMTTILSARHRC